MHVSDIEIVENGVTCELRAQVKCDTHWVWGDEAFPLFYRFPTEFHPFLDIENGDPFIAILLAPAMRLGEPLHISIPVSPKLKSSISRIQTILNTWNTELSRVEVSAPSRRPAQMQANSSGHVGLFFSLGVDSSYSLLKHSQEDAADCDMVDDLIVVEGFDIYLWESERFPPLLNSIQKVAANMGKNVLPVTTNLREFSDRIVDWVKNYHGAALASVPLFLGKRYKKVYIASSQTYKLLVPSGAHPLLDPLWGSESLSLGHDGLEAGRLEKIRSLAQSKELIKHLRVCTTPELTTSYNCGRCEKCLRTMIGLRIAGVLEDCETLPHQIDIELVRSMKTSYSTVWNYLSELYEVLEDVGESGRIKEAIGESLSAAEESMK